MAEEVSLRPRRLAEFVGQAQLKEHLSIMLEAARRREEPVDHMLFAGPPGLGKTSLAGIVANEMGAGFRVTSGPALVRAGDLAALLTNLCEGDVLFVDEIHRLARPVEENPLPGDGGLPARHRARQGRRCAQPPPRPAAPSPWSGPRPGPGSSPGRCGTASASWPGSTTTRSPTWR